jgi:hypothetical protein
LHTEFIKFVRPLYEAERDRVEILKDLQALKNEEMKEKELLNIEAHDGKISRKELLERTLEIHKKYGSRVEALREILHKL